MRHVSLTCKNHPNLRWTCKSIATSKDGGYNGCRNIFYLGGLEEGTKFDAECTCPPSDLILAPGEVWDKECEE